MLLLEVPNLHLVPIRHLLQLLGSEQILVFLCLQPQLQGQILNEYILLIIFQFNQGQLTFQPGLVGNKRLYPRLIPILIGYDGHLASIEHLIAVVAYLHRGILIGTFLELQHPLNFLAVWRTAIGSFAGHLHAILGLDVEAVLDLQCFPLFDACVHAERLFE